MALKYYRHKETGDVKRSFNPLDPKEWQELLVPPAQQFKEAANKATRTSKLRDSTRILKERARNYARDVELDDNIRVNRENGLESQVHEAFLNEKGEKRRKIDDI